MVAFRRIRRIEHSKIPEDCGDHTIWHRIRRYQKASRNGCLRRAVTHELKSAMQVYAANLHCFSRIKRTCAMRKQMSALSQKRTLLLRGMVSVVRAKGWALSCAWPQHTSSSQRIVDCREQIH